jgi:hypothetical protein
MKDNVQHSIGWGTRVIWAGRLMYVELVSPTRVELCPFRVCVGITHDHISVSRWLLYFDQPRDCMYPIWDRRPQSL